MKPILARALIRWLPFVVVSSGIFLFSYWGIQQEYRMGANDPQIQLAEDGAAMLASGGVPAELTRNQPMVDMHTSLSPWIAVYDSSGLTLESTGVLDNAPPKLPAGVFNTSTWHRTAELGVPLATPATETRFTWQPESGVRQAVVLVAVGNGQFVASGRNMRETEARIQTLTQGAGVLWGATELGALLVIILLLAVA